MSFREDGKSYYKSLSWDATHVIVAYHHECESRKRTYSRWYGLYKENLSLKYVDDEGF